MEKIFDFILYALKCAMNVILSLAGKAKFSDHWVVDMFVGIFTIIIIMLVFYAIFMLTGLIKIKNR